MPECLKYRSCPFFQDYQETDPELADRLIALYCRGPYMEQCMRKLYKQLHGTEPPANMTPEGLQQPLKSPS